MHRYVWCRFLAGIFLVVCAPVFALVETDNPLLGVLREQNFNVIQDLGYVHAKAQGLPGLEIRDGADSSVYEVNCKLNTMLYSGTHKRGLARFVNEQGGVWRGLQLDADPEARFVMASWVMSTGRDPAAYRRQLNEWKRDVAGLNAAIYRTLDQWGPDPKDVGPVAGAKRMADLGGGVMMELLPVAAGRFEMGSNNEKPVHTVQIGEAFWMAKTEVTQREYQQVMGTNPSKFTGEDLPVERVSWNDAIAFCEKLTKREHALGRLPFDYEYTLPSEAQWEYAARGGAKSRGHTYSGSDSVGDVAWYKGDSGRKTHPVGQKNANELGLYDMSGNVWEWCMDNWHSDYKGAPTDGRVWSGGNGLYRVNRGGGWNCTEGCCRSAFRGYDVPTRTYDFLGFRVAVVRK